MSASVTSIAPKANMSDFQPQMAKVTAIDEQGRIEKIALLTQNAQQLDNYAVCSQAKHIARATIDDTVLAQNTHQGWVVIAQLASPTDSPSACITDTNGHVNIKGAKSVSLSTSKGTIEVHNDGRIVIDATELSATSERDFTIAGWPIRLN
ncbi:hypothetical protein KO495_13815 [Colwellia sp. D2M02]|uniref:hypothetical protein n=1 Tax=Colwellia sp. D2M02 TaxID=2841562 RepID=UPI001C08FC4A|nr:hypothetical protein [Colwellia sp. D2M02]MBU2894387.1 hypothetical protein [Colwellia sp. D2M02]